MSTLPLRRVNRLLESARACRVLVVGDVMLDRFVWGRVSRISPEAPVPVVEFDHESAMPGGAANVARNLHSLGVACEVFGVVGNDDPGGQLAGLLEGQGIGCQGLLKVEDRLTSIKTRVIAGQQQVVRVDRETRGEVEGELARRLVKAIAARIQGADAVIVGDYGKGVVTQWLLDELKAVCRRNGVWLSLDPKPVHQLSLGGTSLITPNRKEAYELVGRLDNHRGLPPLQDPDLLRVAEELLIRLQPALLLITLGEQGMLLCQRGRPPFHVPTMAREVFDVSGAGDTVIASFTLAIIAGASPTEAAVFSNHAAGVVVGKVGTAAVTSQEIRKSMVLPLETKEKKRKMRRS